MFGGSKAQGTAADTAAIFTPAKAADNQLYMFNLTLPHGFFSRAPLGATDMFQSKTLAIVSMAVRLQDKNLAFAIWHVSLATFFAQQHLPDEVWLPKLSLT